MTPHSGAVGAKQPCPAAEAPVTSRRLQCEEGIAASQREDAPDDTFSASRPGILASFSPQTDWPGKMQPNAFHFLFSEGFIPGHRVLGLTCPRSQQRGHFSICLNQTWFGLVMCPSPSLPLLFSLSLPPPPQPPDVQSLQTDPDLGRQGRCCPTQESAQARRQTSGRQPTARHPAPLPSSVCPPGHPPPKLLQILNPLYLTVRAMLGRPPHLQQARRRQQGGAVLGVEN